MAHPPHLSARPLAAQLRGPERKPQRNSSAGATDRRLHCQQVGHPRLRLVECARARPSRSFVTRHGSEFGDRSGAHITGRRSSTLLPAPRERLIGVVLNPVRVVPLRTPASAYIQLDLVADVSDFMNGRTRCADRRRAYPPWPPTVSLVGVIFWIVGPVPRAAPLLCLRSLHFGETDPRRSANFTGRVCRLRGLANQCLHAPDRLAAGHHRVCNYDAREALVSLLARVNPPHLRRPKRFSMQIGEGMRNDGFGKSR